MTTSTDIPTRHLPFDAERREMYEAACARLDPNRFRDLLVALIDIHSPTGRERPASEFMADYLRGTVGIDARYQPVSEHTGNALGEHRGSGGGSRLLLYAPIDTHIDPEADVPPWVGPELRPDMIPPRAVVDGDLVIGLGASNPKCMVAGLTEVAHAVVEAGIPPSGRPDDRVRRRRDAGVHDARDNVGMSSGVFHLLTHGAMPDHAVVFKPWWAVYPEEPGMCWFKVSVRGTFGYAGISRGTPGFRSSIVRLPPSSRRSKRGFPSTPHATRRDRPFRRLDLGDPIRKSGQAGVPVGHHRDLSRRAREPPDHPRGRAPPVRPADRPDPGCTSRLRTRLGHVRLTARWRHDPENWIIQSCRRGWEEVEGRPYESTPPARRANRRHPHPQTRRSLCPYRLSLAAGRRPPPN